LNTFSKIFPEILKMNRPETNLPKPRLKLLLDLLAAFFIKDPDDRHCQFTSVRREDVTADYGSDRGL
jgi:hypothetical protein